MPADSTEKSQNTEIYYLKGDATRPPDLPGPKIIPHITNCVGAWGRGFVLVISKRWKEPEREFRKEHNPSLGTVQFIQVENEIWIANMFAQDGIRGRSKGPPIRYEAVNTCLGKVAEKAKDLGASVHMPRIGCSLAGGKWSKIEQIIKKTLIESGVSTTIYDLPGSSFNR